MPGEKKGYNNKGYECRKMCIRDRAVTVLWIALMNLQMKVTDEKNTDNFYSAEGVLDQICTGLQGDISKAYSAGYTKVMENYSDSSINEAGRQSIFAQEYLKSLKGSLESDNTGMHYKTEKLKDYVDSKLTDENSKPHAVVKAVNADENGNGLLKVYNSRAVINGIRVEYTDEKGFKSIIETDISLGVPSMSFTASGGVPELFTYSLVGNEGLEITSGLNKVNLSGNLYACLLYTSCTRYTEMNCHWDVIYRCCSNASWTPCGQAMRQCVNYCQITAPAS